MADYFATNPKTGKMYTHEEVNAMGGPGAWLSQGGTSWDAGSSQDGGYSANQLAPGQQLPYVISNGGIPGVTTPGGSMDGGAAGASQNMGMGAYPMPAAGYAPASQLQSAAGSATGPANGGGNPYLSAQGGAIAQTMSDNLNRNFLPQLGMASMAAGGYGGSAQGVVQANALKDMNTGLSSSLANLYGTDWTNQQNRNLSQYGMDQNFYTAQRGQDQTGAALGANLMTQGQQGQWGPINNASGVYSPYTGLGSTTQTQNSGGGVSGALGGALGAAQLGQNMGWWGGSGGSSTNNLWY